MRYSLYRFGAASTVKPNSWTTEASGAPQVRRILWRVSSAALRHFVLFAGLVTVCVYVFVFTRPHWDPPIHSDGYSYYVYLPSLLLYGDGTLEALSREWYGGAYPDWAGIYRWRSTGRFVNLHPIGAAVLMAPFFIAGHLLTRWSNLPPDGFSLYYQHAAGLAGVAYLLAGLALLRRLLTRHFCDGVVLLTLVTVTWGTNLFHYAVFDGTFSHVYGFVAVTALIVVTDRWYEAPTVGRTSALGLIAAALVLIRHTNAIFLLIVPLYGLQSWRDVSARVVALWRRRGSVAIMIGVAALGVLPQLLMYKRATGSWLVNAYAAFGVFTPGTPHVFGVLFSTQKGLFFWSPLLLAAMAGMIVARGWARHLIVPAVIVLTLQTYLIASWSEWQFGASFGHRGFTDALGLFAVFLAAFFSWTIERSRHARPILVATALVVALSTIQMVQYWTRSIPNRDTTWAQYRASFLRFR